MDIKNLKDDNQFILARLNNISKAFIIQRMRSIMKRKLKQK
jgi:hypothetical protein